ncbi:doublecortin domain-containing protein 2C isoform X4 [Rattus norvegicus]|uniref:doublecortin domain-containing protein 2C isoform X4 n=1 Tax=Rattus norvegicus TaxID=10116 RepID=UPI0019171CA5|nr:doublecortin domain-containing protein 2C isoform X4 [Rattus norvegicus]
MGTRGPYALVDTTPAKTILVYRNGDQFYVGRKFVFSRRRVANFEALLEQLTEQVEVPFGVRRLYTPTYGHRVLELESLQTGGKYVAAGRERFKKLDYIHIVPRKPTKMRKLKEIKPVVHCDINVPSRWQTQSRTSRYINVFTNGRLFIPPIKIIIPKFSLSDWNSVLAMIGEKVFPLGGVRKLFTMDGHLLDDSKNLQDNYFYVAAGLESFKSIPYWKSSWVPSEVQQRFGRNDKYTQTKKRVEYKGKEPLQSDSVPPKIQDSVYYAKEKKQMDTEPLIESGAEGDVYKAQTPAKEAQEALEVKEDPDMKVELPVDQAPAEIVKEIDEIGSGSPGLESGMEKEMERLYEDIDRKGDHSRMSFKKRFPLRHRRKRKASFKSLFKNKEVVPTPEKIRHDILEEKHTLALPETQEKVEVQTDPSVRQESLEKSSLTQDQRHEQQESFIKSSLGAPPPEQRPEMKESPRQLFLGPTPPEHQLEQQEIPEQSSFGPPSPEQQLEQQEIPVQLSLGPPSPEQQLEQPEIPVQSFLGPPSTEQQLEQGSPGQLFLGPSSPKPPEHQFEQQEIPAYSSFGPLSPVQQFEQESSKELSLGLFLEQPPEQ